MSLFNDLMKLCETNDGFFYKDFYYKDGHLYRIFNYRLVGWEDFHNLPGALECRGITYRMEKQGFGSTWNLVCRPMEKFFNAHEGAVSHEWDEPIAIMNKEDGSLISTFIDADGGLGLKSKGSFESEQAESARALLKFMNDDFATELHALTSMGYTVNMEYVAPSNRIVLSYKKPELFVLNVRSLEHGRYVPKSKVRELGMKTVAYHWVEMVEPLDVHHFVASIPEMKGIEGFVIQKKNGEHVKLKTDEYVTLHHSKDSINNPKALYMVALEDATDDLRSLFWDDDAVIEIINNMEIYVSMIYNRSVIYVEKFFNQYSHLERKDYAIAAQKMFDRDTQHLFPLAMNMYLGKEVDYKGVLKKKWRDWRDKIILEVYGQGYEYEENA